MAQIKKIVKPGDLIRGAKVGPAALDKDGNVITLKDLAANAGKVLTVNSDGTVSFQDVPSEFPDGAQSGDVLAWGGETGPEWRPHYPESGSEGDVLTLGETGPEWTTPAGGGSLYLHSINCPLPTNAFMLYLITKSAVPFTTTTFLTFLSSQGINVSGGKFLNVIYKDNDGAFAYGILYRGDELNNNVIIKKGYNGTISDRSLSEYAFHDSVIPII